MATSLFRILLLPLCAAFLLGCQDDSFEVGRESAWELVEIKGSANGHISSPAEQRLQETYTLNADLTFHKIQVFQDTLREAHGTYTVHDDGKGLRLLFVAGDISPVSCYAENYEEFYLTSENRMVNSAGGCDYATLTYRRVTQ